MKRIIAIIVLMPFIIGAFTGVTYGASEFTHKTTKTGKTYTTRFYLNGDYVGKVRTSKRLAVKTVKSEKLTARQLEHRKNRYILVEVIKGKCLDNAGNGKTSDGYYISYSKVKGHKRGAKYTTYCVYANNNYIDDIRIRADFRRAK